MKSDRSSNQSSQPADSKSLTGKIQPRRLTRPECLQDCISRLLTLAVAVADAAGDDRAVDDLIACKMRIQRRSL